MKMYGQASDVGVEMKGHGRKQRRRTDEQFDIKRGRIEKYAHAEERGKLK
jgi:hypothetical protein